MSYGDLEEHEVQAIRGGNPATPFYVAGAVLLLFGFVLSCMIFHFMGDQQILAEKLLRFDGGRVEFATSTKNEVVEVRAHQSRVRDGWATLEGEVVDDDDNVLMSFVDEFWSESGYDEGPWHEELRDLSFKFTVPTPGKYAVELDATEVSASLNNPMTRNRSQLGVVVAQKQGSLLLPLYLGPTLALLGLLMLIGTYQLSRALGDA